MILKIEINSYAQSVLKLPRNHAHAGVYEPVDTDIARHDTAGVTTAQWSVLTLVRGVTSDDTMVLGDAGKTIRSTGSTGSQTFTIPANSSVAYPIGTLIGIENDSSVAWSLAITSDTMTWSKDNTTGTRTLAAGASAFTLPMTSDVTLRDLGLIILTDP